MPGLSIQVDANITPAIRKVTEFKKEMGSIPDALKPLGDNQKIRVFEGSIEEARITVKALKAEIASLGSEQLGAPIGKALSNELQLAKNELKNLEEQAGITGAKTGNIFQQAFSSLRKIAYVLPGIGVAGLIGFATDPIIKYVAGLFSVSEEAKKAQEELLKLKNSLNSPTDISNNAAAGETGTIAKVNALADAVKNSNLPYIERKRALEDLTQINKQYFGDLKLEGDQMGLLTQRVNEYTQALVAQAVVKGFTEEISKVSVEIEKADKELKTLIRTREQLADEASRLDPTIEGELFTTAYDKAVKAVKKADEAIVNQRDKVDLLAQNFAELKSKIGQATVESLKFAQTGGPVVDSLKQQIAVLKELQGLNGLSRDQLSKLVSLEIQLAKRDAVKLGFTKEQLKEKVNGIIEKAFPVDTFVFDTVVTTRVNKLEPSKVGSFKNKYAFDVAKATGLDKIDIDVNNLRLKFPNVKLEIDATGNLEKAITSAFVQFGESLGSIFSDGDFSRGLIAAGKSILGVIGDFIEQVGQQIIELGVAMLALKAALKFSFSNPAIAIAAGLGLVLLGSAFKSFNPSPPKLFEGGIVSSATQFVAGESGPELVTPLNKLPSLLGNNNGNGTQVIRLGIKDRELIAFIERGYKYKNRLS